MLGGDWTGHQTIECGAQLGKYFVRTILCAFRSLAEMYRKRQPQGGACGENAQKLPVVGTRTPCGVPGTMSSNALLEKCAARRERGTSALLHDHAPHTWDADPQFGRGV